MDDFLLNTLKKEELLSILERVSSHLKQNYDMTDDEIFNLAKGRKRILIPASIFSYDLSPAEAIVKFLKENYELRYSEIGELIARDERGVWGSYKRAVRKHQSKFVIKQPDVLIPAEVFNNKKSIFESLVMYLRDTMKMKGKQIADLLNKKPSTIWTVYNRGIKKQKITADADSIKRQKGKNE